MAESFSFDVVSEIDWQEIDNAINQAMKEILQRYDFKGSKSSINYSQKEKTITIMGDDDYKLKAVIDILQNKFVKRGIPLKAMKYKPEEQASGARSAPFRQTKPDTRPSVQSAGAKRVGTCQMRCGTSS